ncbi:MAG TPA: extensin family protein [Alphaproteobacteria bacterium]|nr:extensin family protein [Alphaproteobacteria bacterium]
MSSDPSKPTGPDAPQDGRSDPGKDERAKPASTNLPAVVPGARRVDHPRETTTVALRPAERRRARKASRDRSPGLVRRILRRHAVKGTELVLSALVAAPLAAIVVLSLMPELRHDLLSNSKLKGVVAFFMYDDPFPPPTPSKLWLARLKQTNVVFKHLPDRKNARGRCGYERAVQVTKIGAAAIQGRAIVTWPLAVKLEEWMRTEVQPNAKKLFGQPVTAIKVSSSYDCRLVASKRVLSQHSFANAVDISRLFLADGREIQIQSFWKKNGAFAEFLQRIGAASCGIFSVALTPDFDYQHRHHFHFDVGRRSYCGYGNKRRRLVISAAPKPGGPQKQASR